MSFSEYDPKKITITLGGVVVTGYADGTFVGFERTSDAYTMTTGADNLTTRVKSNDKSGTITITLQQSSVTNNILSSFAALDESANVGVFSFLMKDILGTTLVTAKAAWVKKLPAIEFGNELTNREWVLDCSDSKVTAGGNTVI